MSSSFLDQRDNYWELRDLGQIGKGGFSTVHKVEDLSSGIVFALKKISKDHVSSEVKKRQFLREMKLHRILKHPNIVQFIDCFETDDEVCMVLELCNHETLDSYIRKHRDGVGEELVRGMIRQVSLGVEYLHDHQIVHRDLKPGNIFMHANSRGKVSLKIGDFGFCMVGEEKDSLLLCGTPSYMAPEVIRDGHYSKATDVWSIGILFYTLLVGRTPFQGRDADETMERVCRSMIVLPVSKRISDHAYDFLSLALTKNPSERPTIRDLLKHPFILRRSL